MLSIIWFLFLVFFLIPWIMEKIYVAVFGDKS